MEFKNMAWHRYCGGAEPLQIFMDAGLSLEILGRARIAGFFKLLRHQKEKGLTFNEGREPHTEQAVKAFEFPTPPKRPKNAKKLVLSEEEIAKMFHQVAYLTQEMEFIKKIILTGSGGK